MMARLTLATAIVMTSCSAQAAAPSGWLTLGESAFAALKAQGHKLTIRANRGAAATAAREALYVVEVPLAEVPAIAVTLHRQLRHCGGFMFHDSETAALAALQAVPVPGASAVAPGVTRPGYTISAQEVVTLMLARMDHQQIAATIDHLASFVNRQHDSEHGAQASDWLLAHWRKLGAGQDNISVEQIAHRGYRQRSVVATIAGTDRASEVVVLGAHLDSINLLSSRASARAPGADDDASGVAALTEVLRVIKVARYRPRRTIKLIAYAAEEVGLRGSQDIARAMRSIGTNVVGVLQLDMTSYKGSEKDIYLISDYTDAAQNDFLARLVKTYLPGATLGSDECGYACSDHAAWNALGYAASMPFEARMAQDNPTIHSARDLPAAAGTSALQVLLFARLAAAFTVELGSESK